MSLRFVPPVVRDPPEKWELMFTEREGGSYFRGSYASHPYSPKEAEEVPAGALGSLEETCGLEDLRQVFIIPWAVRFTGGGAHKVISPNSVLALGARAVALWTEKPEPGVRIVIPLEGLSAIEDITILLYGRLSFIPFRERLTIRYNTVSRPALEPALLRLRKRLAGAARPVPGTEAGETELTFKWHNIFHDLVVRLEQGAPAAHHFAITRGRSRRDEGRAEMAVLNPWELVYLCDPSGAPPYHGSDSIIIPRSRITSAQEVSAGVEVISNGTPILLPVERLIREAVLGWVN